MAKGGVMKKHISRCIVCTNRIEICFNPPIKRINCIELECCNGKPKISPHILIVDDEPTILRTLSRMLEKVDYVVDTAYSEKEALSIIETEHIDLVISDLNLGTDDGLRLLDKIRKQRPEIKTILMSAYLVPEDKIKILKIDSFLHKPFEFQELKKIVEKVLRRSK